ncbi:MAG: hypothetical protein PWP21_1340 [Thermosediminibacterales bacterium]|nr:hypothetical protein [Thermosediminibacterales bacterium]
MTSSHDRIYISKEKRGWFIMFKATFLLGATDFLKNEGTILELEIQIINENSYKILEKKVQTIKGELSQGSYKNLTNKKIGELFEGGFLNDVKGFYIFSWEDIKPANSQLEHFERLGRAIVYFCSGALGLGLSYLDDMDLTQSDSMFFEETLSEDLRVNIYAEYLYGNNNFKNNDFLNTFILNIPGENPKKLFSGDKPFYILPAGLKHEKRIFSIPFLKVGENIIFQHETNNIHDPNAVRLWTPEGIDLGYVPRSIASSLAFHIRNGDWFNGRVALVIQDEGIFPDKRVAVRVEKKSKSGSGV